LLAVSGLSWHEKTTASKQTPGDSKFSPRLAPGRVSYVSLIVCAPLRDSVPRVRACSVDIPYICSRHRHHALIFRICRLSVATVCCSVFVSASACASVRFRAGMVHDQVVIWSHPRCTPREDFSSLLTLRTAKHWTRVSTGVRCRSGRDPPWREHRKT